MNALDEKVRDAITASYALPDLETALQQVMYNAIDAHAKSIKLSVDIASASFTAVDDGDGIQPDDLYQYIGEYFASSKFGESTNEWSECRHQKSYGSRGAFLYELVSLATTVEIESRVPEHWTSYRKVFEEGEVVFNARSKELRRTPGTNVCVSNLFGKLPVRREDLSRNMKHRNRVIQKIRNFCVSMSMIWPSLSIDVRFQGEEVRPVVIPAAKSCRERFLIHFGDVLGDELQYVNFSSEISLFSIRGYFALIPNGVEGFGQGIKQAKSYYQFTFLDNECVEECHQVCSQTITEAALEYSSAIPIFVLKVETHDAQYDKSSIGRNECVNFKEPNQFRQFLYEFVQKLSNTEEIQVEIQHDQECSSDQEDKSMSAAWKLDTSPVANIICPIIDERTTTEEIQVEILHDQARFRDQEDKSNSAAWEILDTSPVPNIIHRATDERTICSGEGDLKDIFFPNESRKSFVPSEDIRAAQDAAACTPWLSSTPDAYDVADTMLNLCHDRYDDYFQANIDRSGCDEDIMVNTDWQSVAFQESQDCNNQHPLPSIAPDVDTKSDYFTVRTTEQQPNSSLQRFLNFKVSPIQQFAAALHVDNVRVLKGNRDIKISKAMLSKMQVIRQVDRKFILVQVDTSRGKFILCIDQHAADERVRLEKMEEEMFGRDGSLRRVEIQIHDPPILLRINFKERNVLLEYDEFIRSWGFDFECIVSEPETTFFMTKEPEFQENDQVLMHSTPVVDKRVANANDFRDFIQLLSNTGKVYPHSKIRPPVITRLLHSRACRTAIMFGDRLSLGQCNDLIEELKMCQLPFQCAHGRPSVVPLAEIDADDHK